MSHDFCAFLPIIGANDFIRSNPPMFGSVPIIDIWLLPIFFMLSPSPAT
jgi:hypothetical protein